MYFSYSNDTLKERMFKAIKPSYFSQLGKAVKIQWDKQAACLKVHAASITYPNPKKKIGKAKQ